MKSDETKIQDPKGPEETPDDQPTEEQTEQTAQGSSLLVKALMMLLVLAAGGASAAAYYYHGEATKVQVNPQEAAQAEVAALLDRISQLILLPADEQPTVATVADPDKLKDQLFFKNSHKGDKVLIYTKARKAVLYDPVAHKIIEVAPVSIGSETAGTTTPPAETTPPTDQ